MNYDIIKTIIYNCHLSIIFRSMTNHINYTKLRMYLIEKNNVKTGKKNNDN